MNIRDGMGASTLNSGPSRAAKQDNLRKKATQVCSKCGAWKGELGHNPEVDCLAWARGAKPCGLCFVCGLRLVFDECWRVLKSTGSLAVVIGDSYASGKSRYSQKDDSMYGGGEKEGKLGELQRGGKTDFYKHSFLKDGDLCGVPFRLALALQADGWLWRSDIVWQKASAKPESVFGSRWERHRIKIGNRGRDQSRIPGHAQNHSGNTVIPDAIWQDCLGCEICKPNDGYVFRNGMGRLTRSHEQVLIFAKSGEYFWDTYGIMEDAKYDGRQAMAATSVKYAALVIGNHQRWQIVDGKPKRNARDCWTISPEPLTAKHYASFPTKLVAKLVQAMTSEKVCVQCGKPWVRLIHRDNAHLNDEAKIARYVAQGMSRATANIREHKTPGGSTISAHGWKASCNCNADDKPSVVLDIFCGSGTTVLVAERMGRKAIGLDLNFAYLDEIARVRIAESKLPMPPKKTRPKRYSIPKDNPLLFD